MYRWCCYNHHTTTPPPQDQLAKRIPNNVTIHTIPLALFTPEPADIVNWWHRMEEASMWQHTLGSAHWVVHISLCKPRVQSSIFTALYILICSTSIQFSGIQHPLFNTPSFPTPNHQ